jgi:hypothetical protein
MPNLCCEIDWVKHGREKPPASNHRSVLNKGITMSGHLTPMSRPTGIPISFSYISFGACSRAAGGGIFERSAACRENLASRPRQRVILKLPHIRPSAALNVSPGNQDLKS